MTTFGQWTLNFRNFFLDVYATRSQQIPYLEGVVTYAPATAQHHTKSGNYDSVWTPLEKRIRMDFLKEFIDFVMHMGWGNRARGTF